MTNDLRVIKVGGSLFDLPGVGERLNDWLNAQPPAQHVLIAGGGKLADAIREADRVHQLGEQTGHWLCVQLLDVSAQLLACLLPSTPFVREFAALQAALQFGQPGRWILAVEDFLRRWEPQQQGLRLPHDWQTSSDAIAARVATTLGAEELVLVKSCDLPPGLDRRAAAARSLVDPVLPEVAQSLKLTWVNLRDDEMPGQSLW